MQALCIKGKVNLFPLVSFGISLHLSIEDSLIHHCIFLTTGTVNLLFEYAEPS